MTERPCRLYARFVETIQELGTYGDGRGSGGLSHRVKRTARGQLAKSWGQRISVDGRPCNLGLGTWPHKCVLELRACQRGELVTGRRRTIPTFAEAVEKVLAAHPGSKACHERLTARGNPPGVALVAVMRKLASLLNTLLREDRMWQAAPHPPVGGRRAAATPAQPPSRERASIAHREHFSLVMRLTTNTECHDSVSIVYDP